MIYKRQQTAIVGNGGGLKLLRSVILDVAGSVLFVQQEYRSSSLLKGKQNVRPEATLSDVFVCIRRTLSMCTNEHFINTVSLVTIFMPARAPAVNTVFMCTKTKYIRQGRTVISNVRFTYPTVTEAVNWEFAIETISFIEVGSVSEKLRFNWAFNSLGVSAERRSYIIGDLLFIISRDEQSAYMADQQLHGAKNLVLV